MVDARFAFVGVVVAASVAAAPRGVHACRCSEPRDFDGARKAAAAIFVATCKTRAKDTRLGARYLCTAERVFKGPVRRTYTVWAGGHCGGEFAPKTPYLVYAMAHGRQKGTYYSNRCVRTMAVVSAAADLKRLGKGRRPPKAPSARVPPKQ